MPPTPPPSPLSHPVSYEPPNHPLGCFCGQDAYGSPLCLGIAGLGDLAILSPLLMSYTLPLQKHVVETFFGFDEESVDSETLSETSCNTDRTDRAPATPEEDLDDVSTLPLKHCGGTSGLWQMPALLYYLKSKPMPQTSGKAVPTQAGQWTVKRVLAARGGPFPSPRAGFTEEVWGGLGYLPFAIKIAACWSVPGPPVHVHALTRHGTL